MTEQATPAATQISATLQMQSLAAGPGWSVSDFICSAGPDDRPYEERHGSVCIAIVTAGSFVYRSSSGSALMAPGSILLGSEGVGFECSHKHSCGDRCISFQFDPDYFETVIAGVPGVRTAFFKGPRLPPLQRLAPLIARAEIYRHSGDVTAFEELSVSLAGAVARAAAGADRAEERVTEHDLRRITRSLRLVEADPSRKLSLRELASEVAMSHYHFLRVFQRLMGITPYQYALQTRLNQAAVALRQSTDPVTTIALAAGFNDLSTFNRKFREVMGMNPRSYRLSPQTRLGGPRFEREQANRN